MIPSCMPPCPGKGMSITISIDLGDFLGHPGPHDDKPSCDDDNKLTYFNENNDPKKYDRGGFGDARDRLMNKSHDHEFGHPGEKKDHPKMGGPNEDDEKDTTSSD